MKFKYLALLTLVLSSLLLFGVVGQTVEANHVTPTLVAGNTSCAAQGYAFGFKPQPEPPPSGTYTFPGTSFTVTIQSDGTFFDWTSTLGIDAVLVKGGNDTHVYTYNPESFGDTGLHSPLNNGGQQAAISHIEFCYDFELQVSKTASGSFDRTYTWTIDKSVTPETWDLFRGDSGTSKYTVSVDQTVVDSNFVVSGLITVTNPSGVPVNFTVSDSVGGVAATISNCPASVPANSSVQCSYSATVADATPGTNTATVTSNTGGVGGGTGSAPYTFTPTIHGSPEIDVDDTNGSSWHFAGDGSVDYNKTFTCDGDEGTHNNTATIRGSNPTQSDSASVVVNCHELNVTKDATPTFGRAWNWTISKSGDQTNLLLSVGQQFTVNYQVNVNATATNSYAVTGNIHVSNPAPISAEITSVSDLISGVGAANVVCPGVFPYTIAANGGTLDCTYSSNLPNADQRLNTATASLQNYSYDSNKVGTPSGTTPFSGTANITFNGPTSETDECAAVSDDKYGFLGNVCATDANKTFTFNYSLSVGPYLTCGQYQYKNIASFTTNDTGASGSDDHVVNVNVPCGGCTLTPGYWKTHSKYGPAPSDSDWYNLGDADGDGVSEGPDETFFKSGKTWYQVLWTPPSGGNAYYILAHAYIAAKLNIVNGASSTTAVNTAIASAQTFFNTYTPSSTLTKAQRNAAISAAGVLDNYNNGIIGPGHCSE